MPPGRPQKIRSEKLGLIFRSLNQGPLNGGFSNGGVSRSGLVLPFCPFLSFLGLSRFFWDFPDLLGDGPGIFPICPFPLSWPIKSTYEEQPERVRDTIWTFPEKSGKPPGLETPRFSFSQPTEGLLAGVLSWNLAGGASEKGSRWGFAEGRL